MVADNESETRRRSSHSRSPRRASPVEGGRRDASPGANPSGDRRRSASPLDGDSRRRADRSASPGGARRPAGAEVGLNPGNNLHVSRLSRETRESQLEELFGKYGKLQKVQIMVDPHTRESRQFGFATYEENDAAAVAIENLNDYELDGRRIVVEMAKRGRPRTPTPGRYYGPPKLDRERRPGAPYDRYGDRGGGYDRGGYGGGGYYDRPPPPRYGGYGGYPPPAYGYGAPAPPPPRYDYDRGAYDRYAATAPPPGARGGYDRGGSAYDSAAPPPRPRYDDRYGRDY